MSSQETDKGRRGLKAGAEAAEGEAVEGGEENRREGTGEESSEGESVKEDGRGIGEGEGGSAVEEGGVTKGMGAGGWRGVVVGRGREERMRVVVAPHVNPEHARMLEGLKELQVREGLQSDCKQGEWRESTQKHGWKGEVEEDANGGAASCEAGACLHVIDADVAPAGICTRREFATWLMAFSEKLSASPTDRVYPAMFIEGISEQAYADQPLYHGVSFTPHPSPMSIPHLFHPIVHSYPIPPLLCHPIVHSYPIPPLLCHPIVHSYLIPPLLCHPIVHSYPIPPLLCHPIVHSYPIPPLLCHPIVHSYPIPPLLCHPIVHSYPIPPLLCHPIVHSYLIPPLLCHPIVHSYPIPPLLCHPIVHSYPIPPLLCHPIVHSYPIPPLLCHPIVHSYPIPPLLRHPFVHSAIFFSDSCYSFCTSRTGLAEAGILPSLLGRKDEAGGAAEGEGAGEGEALFRPDSPLTRQDLLTWRFALEYSHLPPPDLAALRHTCGLIDAARISPAAQRAVSFDFLHHRGGMEHQPEGEEEGWGQAGGKGLGEGQGRGQDFKSATNAAVIPLVFGNVRRFDPLKPVTHAQAAAALTFGRTYETVNEAAVRVEVAEARKEADVARQEADEGEVGGGGAGVEGSASDGMEECSIQEPTILPPGWWADLIQQRAGEAKHGAAKNLVKIKERSADVASSLAASVADGSLQRSLSKRAEEAARKVRELQDADLKEGARMVREQVGGEVARRIEGVREVGERMVSMGREEAGRMVRVGRGVMDRGVREIREKAGYRWAAGKGGSKGSVGSAAAAAAGVKKHVVEMGTACLLSAALTHRPITTTPSPVCSAAPLAAAAAAAPTAPFSFTQLYLSPLSSLELRLELFLLPHFLTSLTPSPADPAALVPKKNRLLVYKYLFSEGVLFAEKDFNLPKHPELEVPNLQVIKLMQSFKSKGFVRETFAWRHYYWYLTNEGIEHLRDYLNLPSEIVPATLKKSSRPPGRPMGAGGDRPPRRFEGGRGYGDREGYRGYGAGGDDKAGAPGAYKPAFREVSLSTLTFS
ncbi:unnamed protein product [Closterium sp. Naga37s-1]|nr:unnamed protein product [Closterium sp. Naga37s-1]